MILKLRIISIEHPEPSKLTSESFLQLHFDNFFLLLHYGPIIFCTLCRSSCYFLFIAFPPTSFSLSLTRGMCVICVEFHSYFGLLMEKFLPFFHSVLFLLSFRGTSLLLVFGRLFDQWTLSLSLSLLLSQTHKNPFIGEACFFFIEPSLPKQVMHETFFKLFSISSQNNGRVRERKGLLN